MEEANPSSALGTGKVPEQLGASGRAESSSGSLYRRRPWNCSAAPAPHREALQKMREKTNASLAWWWARLAGTNSPSWDAVTRGRTGSHALGGAMGWGPDPALAGLAQR